MKKKIRVGIIFGGQSSEHEVSIQSAKNIFEALDKDRYDPVLIGINKKGQWLSLDNKDLHQFAAKTSSYLPEKVKAHRFNLQDSVLSKEFDVIFPVLHGQLGEDGTVQGLFRLMGVPFVGADVLGSAIGMDKDVMKRLLRDAGIPVVKFLVFQKNSENTILVSGASSALARNKSWTSQDDKLFLFVKKELRLPFFVKPANAGSSIGVSKVRNKAEFTHALDEAFKYDRKILIEQGLDAREIECSILGNNEKIASIPGEIIPIHEFYDYEAKYIDKEGAKLEVPANLSQKQIKIIQNLSIKTCEVLCIDSMARVDFFIDNKTNKIYLNEVNTIPGFTNISMYPKLWEASGISYTELINRLILLAREKSSR